MIETELSRDEIDVIEEALEHYQNASLILEVDEEKLGKITETLKKVKDLVFEEYQGEKPK